MTITSPAVLASYKNGSFNVTLYEDGTKERLKADDLSEVLFPESIDVKITDFCDIGCPWCHESSTQKGMHGDLGFLLDQIRSLPKGIELAIGGGNPLSHPQLKLFLQDLKALGYIANLTVNQGHLSRSKDNLIEFLEDDLIKGLGISIKPKQIFQDFSIIKELQNVTQNIVFHVIAGIHDIAIIESLKQFDYCKVLVLGYKDFGFGLGFHEQKIDDSILRWKQQIHSIIGKLTVCFDNLAIEQLQIRRFFTDEEWSSFYMGDDFTHSMYCDAVKQEWAQTSRSCDRVSMHKVDLIHFFSKS